mgnify:CR=1 FL=1
MTRHTGSVPAGGALCSGGKAMVAQGVGQAGQQNAQMAARDGQPPQKLVLEGARIRIEFTKNGRVLEEILSAVINCTESRMTGLMTQPSYVYLTCASRSVVLSFAPKGPLASFRSSPHFTH